MLVPMGVVALVGIRYLISMPVVMVMVGVVGMNVVVVVHRVVPMVVPRVAVVMGGHVRMVVVIIMVVGIIAVSVVVPMIMGLIVIVIVGVRVVAMVIVRKAVSVEEIVVVGERVLRTEYERLDNHRYGLDVFQLGTDVDVVEVREA